MKKNIKIYTDGSCHPQRKMGAWGAIVFLENKKVILKDIVADTTHNSMELMAVLKGIDYLKKNKIEFAGLEIYTDSQYVVKLPARMPQLIANNFLTKKGNPVRNSELVRELNEKLQNNPIYFTKVVAHQKKSAETNYNREVDQLVRRELREYLKGKKSENFYPESRD